MKELHRLFALSPETARRFREKVRCLALDTDRNALEDFRKTLQETERLTRQPVPRCETVLLNERMDEVFRSSPVRDDGPGQARLQEHWWFDGDGVPFPGPGPARHWCPGASSPTEAYGMAWRGAGQIGEAVGRLVDELAWHGDGDSAVLKGMRVYIVAGLAGNTGRGSWNAVLSKVRECLRENHGVTAFPTAVLFGADVYDRISKCDPRQARDFRVNALTGLSELSGWMENGRKEGDGRVVWRLPDPSLPDPEGRTDVLREDGRPEPCGGPAGEVYLIFGRNPDARLEEPQEYQQMAGKALYAMAGDPENAVRGADGTAWCKSLAGATFEVDALHIRAFCETLAREQMLEWLSEPSREAERAAAAAAKAFWAECPPEAPAQGDELRPEPRGTLYERIAAAAMETPEWRREFQSIRKFLAACKAETEAEERVLPLERPEWLVPLERAAVEALRNAGLQAALEKAAEQVFGGGRGLPLSAWRLQTFLECLRQRIKKAMAAAPERLTVGARDGGGKTPDEAVRESLHPNRKRTLLQKLFRAGTYNAAEIDGLCQEGNPHWQGIIPRGVLAAMYPAIKMAVAKALADLSAQIEKRLAGCEAFRVACRTVRAVLGSEEGLAAGGQRGDDGFRLLYATPDRIQETLYTREDCRRLYHRVLVPVAQGRKEVEWLAVLGMMVCGGVDERLGQALAEATEERIGAERLEWMVGNIVWKGVGLKKGFMEECYAFKTVLKNNRMYWNRALEAEDSPDAREELAERFRATLGEQAVIGDARSGRACLQPAKQLLGSIAESMASGCRPWWIAGTKKESSGVLFLPVRMTREISDGLDRFRKAAGPWCRFDIVGSETGWGTPFAYAMQAEEWVREEPENWTKVLDKVESLDTWRNPEVLEILSKAERQDGTAVFGRQGCTPGVGYVSPLYVRNGRLSGCRWKPWADGPET